LLNSIRDMPRHRVDSAADGILDLGDDVAASIREAFRFNVKRILADLKAEGVLQQDIAKKLDMPSSQLSRWTGMGMIPHASTLDQFILVVNRFLPVAKRIKPEDLFRDPEGSENAKEDLIKELARRAGYEIHKP
jgi:transcriptional regulator with XRE-family HTH domain